MKTLKSLLMLCAGLSFCACNSDNEPQLPEGNGAVTIKIVDPSTRTITSGSGNQQITVEGDIYVTLSYTLSGSQTATKKIAYDSGTGKYSVDGNEFTTGNPEVTFYNIGTPNSVTVSMNGGVASYNDIAINGTTSYTPGTMSAVTGNMQAAPASIPVYKSSTSFKKTGEILKNGEVEYIEYESTVDLNGTIPVARLEVQIQAGANILDGTDNHDFASVAIQGAYLDHILVTPNATGTTNYYLAGDESATKKADGTGDAANAILADSYGTPYALSSGTFAPAKEGETSKYYAYNFYPTTTAPIFKLCLNVTKATGATDEIPTTQYAIIKNYTYGTNAPAGKNEGDAVVFEKGYIYTITALELNADNIQIDEEGTDLAFALTAIVTRAQWTPLAINATWD